MFVAYSKCQDNFWALKTVKLCNVNCELDKQHLEEGRRETENKEHWSYCHLLRHQKVCAFSNATVKSLSGHMTGPVDIMWLINQLGHFAKTQKNHPVKYLISQHFTLKFYGQGKGTVCFVSDNLFMYHIFLSFILSFTLWRKINVKIIRDNVMRLCKASPQW